MLCCYTLMLHFNSYSLPINTCSRWHYVTVLPHMTVPIITAFYCKQLWYAYVGYVTLIFVIGKNHIFSKKFFFIIFEQNLRLFETFKAH